MTSTTPPTVDSLSPRQIEVLELCSRGLTNDDIAGALAITRATVRTHVAAVLRTLDVANRAEAASVYTAWFAAPRQVEALVARPAIAVLAPIALDDDASARAHASGIGHDLASLFARWCWFPVIGQASVNRARSLGHDLREIGRALAARFIVDGTLRRAGDGWRLVLQVDDVDDGSCVWTASYTFSSGAGGGAGLFDVQDAICAEVVAATYPVLVQRVDRGPLGAEKRGVRATRNDLAAWELAHLGMQHQSQRERGATATAQACFARALERDDTLVLAHFGRGLCAYDEILNQWTEPDAASRRLVEAADRCVALAPHAAEGHYLIGRHHQTRGDHAGAAGALEMAIAKNPSFAAAHALLAQALHLSGRSEQALERMRHALRLGPRLFVAGLATLHFARREYAEALEAAEGAIAIAPRYTYARALAVAAALWLGAEQRARAHMSALEHDYPPFETTGFLKTFGADVEAVAAIHQALVALRPR